jgi:hypothetical protein
VTDIRRSARLLELLAFGTEVAGVLAEHSADAVVEAVSAGVDLERELDR